MTSKYQPLRDHLQLVAGSTGRLSMTLDDVGRLVGGLPPSASTHREWWANSPRSQGRAWIDAGYRVAAVDLHGQRVEFRRHVAEPVSAVRVDHLAAETWPVAETVSICVEFEWRAAGRVQLDAGGKPSFPDLPAVPGVYRLTLLTRDPAGRPRTYIGESDNLRRRLSGNYRNPGSSQQTSLRVNALLRQHLAAGGPVTVDVAVQVSAAVGTGEREPIDLGRKANRLLAENAALAVLRAAGASDVENLG